MKSESPLDNPRIQAIAAFAAKSAPPGYEHIIEAAKADGRSYPADVAQAIIKEIQREHAAAASAATVPSAHDVLRFPDLEAVQCAALQTWSSNASVRAEFGNDQVSYLAYRKAEALGRVRVAGGHRR